jgi:hypothetical protein
VRQKRSEKAGEARLTVHLADGVAAGPVLRFTETGVEAHLDGEVPRDARHRFTLQLREGVVSGELFSLGQEGPLCRAQFVVLHPESQALLAPLIEA